MYFRGFYLWCRHFLIYDINMIISPREFKFDFGHEFMAINGVTWFSHSLNNQGK